MSDSSNAHPDEIVVLGKYMPWSIHKRSGGDSTNYPEMSGKLLDLKEGKPAAITFFQPILKSALGNACPIAVVPSHDPANTQSGLKDLIAAVASGNGHTNATNCLVRHTKIQKLAQGGSREVEVHLNSISVANAAAIVGRVVLLIDDVKTTGHSLIACKILLMRAGARSVRMLALVETDY